MYCRVVSFILGLFLVDASSTHPVTDFFTKNSQADGIALSRELYVVVN